MIIIDPQVQCLSCTPNGESHIEECGRVCYQSHKKTTDTSYRDFIRSIIKSGHESVLEHAYASFYIVTDRGVSHQLVRHRIASYSQESTRYCNYGTKGGQITVIKPDGLNSGADFELWRKSCVAAEEAYLKLIENGVKPQHARAVLPSCLKTSLVMTANLREWRHFLKLRLSLHAQPEMRRIAGFIYEELKELYPIVFEDIKYPTEKE